MRVLILYGTTEGQTREVAQRVAEWVENRGSRACIIDSSSMPGDMRLDGFDAYIVAGSVHFNKLQGRLVEAVKENLPSLQKSPSAFIAVSGAGGRSNSKSRAEAWGCIESFIKETGWNPTASTPIGGAMKYTKYNFLTRFVIKQINAKNGGPTDTSRDYVLTDWKALETFVDQFLMESVMNKIPGSGTVTLK